MSEQPLNLKRSLQILRQHWVAVGLIAMLGLFAGVVGLVWLFFLVGCWRAGDFADGCA